MSLATQVREHRPHTRPVFIRLTQCANQCPAGYVMGPIPLHLAQEYVKRGAAVLLEDEAEQDSPKAKRIDHAPRNKSFAST